MKPILSIIFIFIPALAFAEALDPEAYAKLNSEITLLVFGSIAAFFGGAVICGVILMKLASDRLVTPLLLTTACIAITFIYGNIFEPGFTETMILFGFLIGFMIAGIWSTVNIIWKANP